MDDARSRPAHEAGVFERELGRRLVGFRFSMQPRDFLGGILRYRVEKQLVELPIESDKVRRHVLNVVQ